MNLATTFTKTYENRVVLVSNEKYILEDLPNILRHLRREIHADAWKKQPKFDHLR